MSLEQDIVWKGGVWATTVWADDVWNETVPDPIDGSAGSYSWAILTILRLFT